VKDNFVRPLNDATIFEHQLDYWTPQNTDAKYPRILNKDDGSHNYEQSDYWMINAGYLRMKVPGLNISQFNQVKGQPFVTRELIDAFTKLLEE